MKVLVLNCGSSSVKCQVIETTPELIASNKDQSIARVSIEKIGTDEAIIAYEATGVPRKKASRSIMNHDQAIEAVMHTLTKELEGVIEKPEDIGGVGHRIVHGGERFTASVQIDEEVLHEIEECIDLAPLHNPPNLKGYFAARKLLPDAPHVAVFDTSFHQTLPPRSYLYALPYVYYLRHKVRRYGFHGISHRYLSYRYANIKGSTRAAYKLITCHLGNGCSITAIDHGRVVDTSMGFTPLEGLIMGTRSGDVDAAAVLHLMGKEEMTPHEANLVLNKQSGLFGISGLSNDMRLLIEEGGKGNERAKLAVDMFCYRITKYIGAYMAALNGCDAIIFSGGIGENSPPVRAQVCESLTGLGLTLDIPRNNAALSREASISPLGSKPEVWVIPTNEELLIARDTLRTVLGIPHPQ